MKNTTMSSKFSGGQAVVREVYITVKFDLIYWAFLLVWNKTFKQGVNLVFNKNFLNPVNNIKIKMEKTYQCEDCSKLFLRKYNLMKHREYHSDSTYTLSCNECNKKLRKNL